MDNYESNSIVLRAILGFCLSSINKLTPLQYYGIPLPEEKEECIVLYMMNLEIDELKQILELCGLIAIKENNIKFVIDTSGHTCDYI